MITSLIPTKIDILPALTDGVLRANSINQITSAQHFMEPGQLAALLQLSSPALPVGGYSYSQGFEAAVDLNIVRDEASAYEWISQQLKLVMAQCEAPVWALLFDHCSMQNWAQVTYWNNWFHASRETQEMRQETEQMGWSLAKLAADLQWGDAHIRSCLLEHEKIVFPTAHSFSAYMLGVGKLNGLTAYIFSWLENQVLAAMKTVPLGQMAGQRVLNQARQLIPGVINEALARAANDPPRVYTLAPQFAIISSRHETQYSRLFRS